MNPRNNKEIVLKSIEIPENKSNVGVKSGFDLSSPEYILWRFETFDKKKNHIKINKKKYFMNQKIQIEAKNKIKLKQKSKNEAK